VTVQRMGHLDPSGLLPEALGARPDEVWVLRPDAHVAAVLTRAADVAPAVARLLARTQKDPVPLTPRRLGVSLRTGPEAATTTVLGRSS
jgi:3-(3-hydroxy-phenyl)propionate hydroxylase